MAESSAAYEVVELERKNKSAYDSRIEELLTSFSNEGSDEAEIYVYRCKGKTQNQGLNLLEVFPADAHTYATLFLAIRSAYGPGFYRIHVRRAGKIIASEPMEIINNGVEKEKTVRDEDKTNKLLSQILENRKPEIDPEDQEMKFLQKMKLYKELFASDQNLGSNQGNDILGVVSLLEKLGVQVGGKSNDEGFTDVLKGALPIFEKITESLAEKKSEDKRKIVSQSVQSANRTEVDIARTMMQFFLDCARLDSDTDLYAHVLIDKFPEQIVSQFVDTDDISVLVQFNPEFEKYRDWVNKLRLSVTNLLRDDSEDEEGKAEEGRATSDLQGRGEGSETDSQADIKFGGEIF